MLGPDKIDVNDLLPLIGRPDCPRLIDLRIEADFQEDPFLIPGSYHHTFTDPDGLIRDLRGQSAVLICQKGKKISQGLSAWLSTEGVSSRYLEGGMYAWRELPGALRLPMGAFPPDYQPGSPWVVGAEPELSDLAALWLLRRMIGPRARLLFVRRDEVDGIVDRFDATRLAPDSEKTPAFAPLSDRFGLKTTALARVACIVDGARAADDPLTPGVEALAAAASRSAPYDHAQLDKVLWLFDALYDHCCTTERSGDGRWNA